MKKINIRRWYYHIRHRYATMENVVVTVALVIGAGWAWGSIGMMQRNYDLQKNIDTKLRHQKLIELEVELARYQQNYYQSNEYKAWSARKILVWRILAKRYLFCQPIVHVPKMPILPLQCLL